MRQVGHLGLAPCLGILTIHLSPAWKVFDHNYSGTHHGMPRQVAHVDVQNTTEVEGELMPTGKVKWYDSTRGFGFVSNPGDEDVYVGSQVLPEGVSELVPGQRLEYDFAAGRRGPQALRVTVLDEGPRRAKHKYKPAELRGMVQDTITVLDSRVLPVLEAGRRPEPKEARQIAEILRTIARELDS